MHHVTSKLREQRTICTGYFHCVLFWILWRPAVAHMNRKALLLFWIRHAQLLHIWTEKLCSCFWFCDAQLLHIWTEKLCSCFWFCDAQLLHIWTEKLCSCFVFCDAQLLHIWTEKLFSCFGFCDVQLLHMWTEKLCSVQKRCPCFQVKYSIKRMWIKWQLISLKHCLWIRNIILNLRTILCLKYTPHLPDSWLLKRLSLRIQFGIFKLSGIISLDSLIKPICTFVNSRTIVEFNVTRKNNKEFRKRTLFFKMMTYRGLKTYTDRTYTKKKKKKKKTNKKNKKKKKKHKKKKTVCRKH